LARAQYYEIYDKLDTGGILRLHLTHRFGGFSRLIEVGFGAFGFHCVSADMFFLCWKCDYSDATRIARAAAAVS
jgi:UDP-N-acetyl-D-mannosaminuronate dehydrogenase